jgi:hypothetical protein
MAVLNSTQKRKARELCRERDGDKCSIGIRCNNITGEEYRKQSGHDFDLHHLDRNRENNPIDGSNHALACHPCNCAQDPRGKTMRPKFSGFKYLKNKVVKESERVWEGEKEWRWRDSKEKPAAMKKNEISEPIFRAKVRELIAMKSGIAKRKDIIDACSEAAGCAQSTGSRYLDKLASYFGEYTYVGRMDDTAGTIFAIGDIGNYDGEIYVMTKADLEQIRPTKPQETTE